MGCECTKKTNVENEITKENKVVPTEQLKEDELRKDLNGDTSNMLDTVKSGAIRSEEKPKEETKDKEGANSELAGSQSGKGDFNQRILELINEVRADPPAFAIKIEDSMKNIQMEKEKLIYKQKVKVSLTRGKEAFMEAAEKLRTMMPLEPLGLKPELMIPVPQDESTMKDSKYLGRQVEEIKKSHTVDTFFKDMVKVPEVAVLLMVVDDNGKSSGKKRDAILNNSYQSMAVSNVTIGKSFASYFTFSSE